MEQPECSEVLYSDPALCSDNIITQQSLKVRTFSKTAQHQDSDTRAVSKEVCQEVSVVLFIFCWNDF